MSYFHASYLRPALKRNDRKLLLETLVQQIKKSGIQFDTIAFRGASGALVAPSIADILDKEMFLVRKDKDGSHSSYRNEGNISISRYIIIDDLISSGTTIREIMAAVRAETARYRDRRDSAADPICAGIFLYHDQSNYSNTPFQYLEMPQEKIPISSLFIDSYNDPNKPFVRSQYVGTVDEEE